MAFSELEASQCGVWVRKQLREGLPNNSYATESPGDLVKMQIQTGEEESGEEVPGMRAPLAQREVVHHILVRRSTWESRCGMELAQQQESSARSLPHQDSLVTVLDFHLRPWIICRAFLHFPVSIVTPSSRNTTC